MQRFLKYSIGTTLTCLFLSGIAFIYCMYREDLAMPKSGLGDVEQFIYWYNLSVIAKNSLIMFLALLAVEIIFKLIIDYKKL